MIVPSSPIRMAHRSSPSRSYLLAPAALRGLHLDSSHAAGQSAAARKGPNCTETLNNNQPTKISYTKLLTEPHPEIVPRIED
jgi:hypothetical protein